MMEIQVKEELIDMKAELDQGEKIYRKTYLVRLGVDNPCLGVDARLGIDNPRIGVGRPSLDEDMCLRLGVAQFT